VESVRLRRPVHADVSYFTILATREIRTRLMKEGKEKMAWEIKTKVVRKRFLVGFKITFLLMSS
jgi:hypothetical protein